MGYIIGVTNLAKELGVCRKTIYNYMNLGMPFRESPSGRKIFLVKEIEQWLQGGL